VILLLGIVEANAKAYETWAGLPANIATLNIQQGDWIVFVHQCYYASTATERAARLLAKDCEHYYLAQYGIPSDDRVWFI
jgi:hypothetical protein